MAFQPAERVAELVIKATVAGENVFNTLRCQKVDAGPWTNIQLTDLIDQAYAHWHGGVMSNLSEQYTLQSMVATDISIAGGLQEVDASGAGEFGGIASGTPPNNVCWAVKFTTGHVGRSYRGRMFIGGLPLNAIVGNNLSSLTAGNLITDIAAMITALDTVDLTPVIVQRWADKVKLAEAVMHPITAVSYTDLVLDSMRTRLPGRGD